MVHAGSTAERACVTGTRDCECDFVSLILKHCKHTHAFPLLNTTKTMRARVIRTLHRSRARLRRPQAVAQRGA